MQPQSTHPIVGTLTLTLTLTFNLTLTSNLSFILTSTITLTSTPTCGGQLQHPVQSHALPEFTLSV